MIQVNALHPGSWPDPSAYNLSRFCSMEQNAAFADVAPRPQARHTDCGTAFRQIVTGCVQALGRQRSAAAERNADAVHKMRIQLTRLSTALLFFSPIVADPAWRRIASRVRSLNSRLGKARDQDVMVQYSCRRRYRKWAQSNLRSIERARAKRYRKLAAGLGSGSFQRLLHDIDREARRSTRPINELCSADVVVFAETRLSEWRSDIERRGRHFERLGQKQQHRLRLKCKHYRYIVDLLLDLGAGLASQDLLFRDVAKRVHALLGDVRDLRRFKDMGRGRPPGYRTKQKKLLNAAANALRSHR